MKTENEFRPTKDRPLLLGLLVDVSGSMRQSMENDQGRSINRLDGVRESLEQLVKRGGELARVDTGERVAPLLKLFAYGFGFGGLLSLFLGRSGSDVRDLLALPGEHNSLVPLDQLVDRWTDYRSHVESLGIQMFGDTPMRAGFRIALDRFRAEIAGARFSGQPILFVISDGDPTDATAEEVESVAADMKRDGVIIVSCYVTSGDLAEPRRLYGQALPHWPRGARLMLECASIAPPESPFVDYLSEYRWTVESGGRLFCQVNQSEVLSEFMSVILSPLRQSASLQQSPSLERRADALRVFVSYSHADSPYVDDSGLLGYLRGLRREGFEFWHDRRLVAGEAWDSTIKAELRRADIVLVLVSQAFLNSAYCIDVEAKQFLSNRASSGCVIFPVIVSPCDWRSYDWLAATQFEPRDGRTIEGDFRDRGSREALYLRILEQLRQLGNDIRKAR